MRKIRSKEDVAKGQRIKQTIIGVILIFVMLSSIIGFGFFSGGGDDNGNEQTLEYNGYEFSVGENRLWEVQIEDQTFLTNYHPSETEDIVVDFNLGLDYIRGSPLYYVRGNEHAINVILYNLGRYSTRNPQEVCLTGEECGGDLINKDCSSNVVVFKEPINDSSETIKIYKEENCVFIKATSSEQVRSADRLVFKILGIQE
jgi:hypothetical protein